LSRALPRPPRRITPGDFYATYLPSVWDAYAEGLPELLWRIGAEIHIEGTGPFWVGMDQGKLLGGEGPTESPVARIRCDRASWELMSLDLWPRIVRWLNSRLDESRKKAEVFLRTRAPAVDLQKLSDQPGNILFHLVDDAGDEARFHVTLGSGQGPETTVKVTERDLWTLLEGSRLSSFLKSRVEVEGNLAYLLALTRVIEG